MIPLDLRTHGGKEWQIEPRIGYVSCRLRDVESGKVVICGTLKQIMRYLSGPDTRRVLGARNLQ